MLLLPGVDEILKTREELYHELRIVVVIDEGEKAGIRRGPAPRTWLLPFRRLRNRAAAHRNGTHVRHNSLGPKNTGENAKQLSFIGRKGAHLSLSMPWHFCGDQRIYSGYQKFCDWG